MIGAKVAPADAGGSGGRKADLPQLLFELSRRPAGPRELQGAAPGLAAQAQAQAHRRLKVAAALKHLADASVAWKAAMVRGGALPVLCRVLEEGSGEVQLQVLTMLWYLSRLDTNLRPMLETPGLVKALLRALSWPSCRLRALNAIGNIALGRENGRDMLGAGAGGGGDRSGAPCPCVVPSLLQLVRSTEGGEVRTKAVKALHNLTLSAEARAPLLRFVDEGTGEGGEGQRGGSVISLLLGVVATDLSGTRAEALKALNNLALLRAGDGSDAVLTMLQQMRDAGALSVLGAVVRQGSDGAEVGDGGVQSGAAALAAGPDDQRRRQPPPPPQLIVSLRPAVDPRAIALSALMNLLAAAGSLDARITSAADGDDGNWWGPSMRGGASGVSVALVRAGVAEWLLALLARRRRQLGGAASITARVFQGAPEAARWGPAGVESRALSMLMRLAQEAAAAKAAVEDSLPTAATGASDVSKCRALGSDDKAGGGWLQEQLRAKGVGEMVAALLLRRPSVGLGSAGASSNSAEMPEEATGGQMGGRSGAGVHHFGIPDAMDSHGEWIQEERAAVGSHQLLKAAMIAAFLAGKDAGSSAAAGDTTDGVANDHAKQLALHGPPLTWCSKVLALLQQRLAHLMERGDEGRSRTMNGGSDGGEAAGFDSTVFELGTLLLAVRCSLARLVSCSTSAKRSDDDSTGGDLCRPWTAKLLLRSMALCSGGYAGTESSQQWERDTCLLHATAALLHLLCGSSPDDSGGRGAPSAHAFIADPRSGARALLEQLRLFAAPQRVRIDAARILWELGPSPFSAAGLVGIGTRQVGEVEAQELPHPPLLHAAAASGEDLVAPGESAGAAGESITSVQSVMFSCCAAACVGENDSDGLLRARRRLVAQLRAAGVHVVFAGGAGDPCGDPSALASAAAAADAVIVELSASSAADARCRLLTERMARNWDAEARDGLQPVLLAHLQVRAAGNARVLLVPRVCFACARYGLDCACAGINAPPPFLCSQAGYVPEAWLRDLCLLRERREWLQQRVARRRQRQQKQRALGGDAGRDGGESGDEEEQGTEGGGDAIVLAEATGAENAAQDFLLEADCSVLASDADVTDAVARLAGAVAEARAASATHSHERAMRNLDVPRPAQRLASDGKIDRQEQWQAQQEGRVQRQRAAVARMGEAEVVTWLAGPAGLASCCEHFAAAGVDGESLLQLGAWLREAPFERFASYVSAVPPIGLGIAKAGHVLKLGWQLRQLLDGTGPPGCAVEPATAGGDNREAAASMAAPVGPTAGAMAGSTRASAGDGDTGGDAGDGGDEVSRAAAAEERARKAEAAALAAQDEREDMRRQLEALRCSTNKTLACLTCQRLFNTQRALAQHGAATGHDVGAGAQPVHEGGTAAAGSVMPGGPAPRRGSRHGEAAALAATAAAAAPAAAPVAAPAAAPAPAIALSALPTHAEAWAKGPDGSNGFAFQRSPR